MLTSDVAMNMYDPRTGNQAVDKEGNSTIDLMAARFKISFDDRNFFDYGDTGNTTPKGAVYNLKVSGIYDTSSSFEYYNTAFIDLESLKPILKDNKDFTGYDLKTALIPMSG